jgi:hypothetical protein
MKKIQNASTNDLEELGQLVQRIETIIQRDFIHVEDYLPKPLVKAVSKLSTELEKEFDRREFIENF